MAHIMNNHSPSSLGVILRSNTNHPFSYDLQFALDQNLTVYMGYCNRAHIFALPVHHNSEFCIIQVEIWVGSTGRWCGKVLSDYVETFNTKKEVVDRMYQLKRIMSESNG